MYVQRQGPLQLNASSIFHELSSYGTIDLENREKRIFGMEAIKQSMSEIKRTLVESGYFYYRDLGYPLSDDQNKSVVYNYNLFYKFWDCFFDDFLTKNYLDEKKSINTTIKHNKIDIKMKPILHAEFQRHFLTFRAYIVETFLQYAGLNVKNHFWKNSNNGEQFFMVERVNSTLDLNLHSLIKNYPKQFGSNNIHKVHSDDFDDIINKVLIDHWNHPSFQSILSNWISREGNEKYYYADVGQMLKVGLSSSYNDGHVLFPDNNTSIKFLERSYYNRLLQKIINKPEVDYKQMIAFKKMTLSNAHRTFEEQFKNSYFLHKNNTLLTEMRDFFEK